MKYVKRFRLLAVIVTLLFILSGCDTGPAPASTPSAETKPTEPGAELEVHFLDVGQADCILFLSDGHAMLIDAGNNADEEFIRSFLDGKGITAFDYVIGTHPHEDHIGSLDGIIRNYQVDTVILPDKIHTSKTFSDVLDALEEKDLSITLPHFGDTYTMGDVSFTIVTQDKDYRDNLNNWSVGVRVTLHDISFLLCGDLETDGEKDVLDSSAILHSDVLKVSHHGSRTSTSQEFLDAVSPDYSVIQVGLYNDYGHPTQDVMDRLAASGTQIFRTDTMGTVTAKTDGYTITWNTEPESSFVAESSSSAPQNVQTYVLNINTKKFHLPECGSVNQMKEESRQETNADRETLLEEGYEPCKNCNP